MSWQQFLRWLLTDFNDAKARFEHKFHLFRRVFVEKKSPPRGNGNAKTP